MRCRWLSIVERYFGARAAARAIVATGFDDGCIRPDSLRLITLRSNDQFNTTVYGYDDRFRGIRGTRDICLMNPADMDVFGLADADTVSRVSGAQDGVERIVRGLRVVPYAIPRGCVAGYYPELNALVPLWHHAEGSKVPASKSVPVLVVKASQETSGQTSGA
ncbi:molybdopterin dinucleotide binding domain-containing protein [Labrys monachus]|nr:molybdopterin dinucleotide binding domain-containing protein [Labrys monachus]